jgi:hypothetical protein
MNIGVTEDVMSRVEIIVTDIMKTKAYIYIYEYIYIYIYMYIFIHIYMHIPMYTYIYIYADIYIFNLICIYINIYILGGVTEDIMSMVESIVTDIMKMEEERDEILESAGKSLVDEKVTIVCVYMHVNVYVYMYV